MKVSIVGVTGYSGLELVKILRSHPYAELVSIYATKEVGQDISNIYPHLEDISDLQVAAFDAEKSWRSQTWFSLRHLVALPRIMQRCLSRPVFL